MDLNKKTINSQDVIPLFEYDQYFFYFYDYTNPIIWRWQEPRIPAELPGFKF
jgi:hypothetical protein